ncbi:MAG: hypothetical protein AAF630_10975 [Cyanobacteria bacterium P01_C01_bin.38]
MELGNGWSWATDGSAELSGITNYQLPTSNYQLPMPYAPCPMPYSLCPILFLLL